MEASRKRRAATQRASAAAPSVRPIEAAGPGDSAEVGLHELGESFASIVGSVQAELSRYPHAAGSHVLDELEVSVPVRMRVDELGQPLVTVVSRDTPSPGLAYVRLRLRPVPGPPPPVATAVTLPLSALRVLRPQELSRLAARRLFSVADLQRVALTPRGQASLGVLGLRVPVTELLDRAAVLTLPTVPPIVARALLSCGITSPARLLAADTSRLATLLSQALHWPIIKAQVRSWQCATAEHLGLPIALPPERPVPPEAPPRLELVQEPGAPPSA